MLKSMFSPKKSFLEQKRNIKFKLKWVKCAGRFESGSHLFLRINDIWRRRRRRWWWKLLRVCHQIWLLQMHLYICSYLECYTNPSHHNKTVSFTFSLKIVNNQIAHMKSLDIFHKNNSHFIQNWNFFYQ